MKKRKNWTDEAGDSSSQPQGIWEGSEGGTLELGTGERDFGWARSSERSLADFHIISALGNPRIISTAKRSLAPDISVGSTVKKPCFIGLWSCVC